MCLCSHHGRHLGGLFDTNLFTVNCTSIKRETVLLLKEQYVTVGLVGQTMLFVNIS